MFELLGLVGGFWFFLFVVACLVAGIVSNEMDNFFGGALTITFLAFGLQLFFGIPILQSIIANPLFIFLGLFVYTAVGVVYGVLFRYKDFLKEHKDGIKDSWKEYEGTTSHPTEEGFLKSYRYSEFSPSHNADRITAWILLWPWGVFWDLCHKPARFIYNNMHSFVGRMLDKVGMKVTKDIINEKK